MSDSPSAILSRAADLIRDTAAAATPGQWEAEEQGGERVELVLRSPSADVVVVHRFSPHPDSLNRADARWIALMSPAVAPMIEKWLRDTAAYFDEFADYWITIPEQARDALALARAVLGEKEETDG